jgi:hypothetical protein
MKSSTKLKTLVGACGVGAALTLTMTPAFAAGTGNETITSPSSPYTPTVDANANPVDSSVVVSGTGYTQGASVYAEVCDGLSESAPGWDPGSDCDPLTETAGFPTGSQHTAPGAFTFNGANPNLRIVVFRGLSPNNQFNCLAPGDNPNSTSVTVSNASDSTQVAQINPALPSWGASTVGLAGGGKAGCQIRITYTPDTPDITYDKFITLSLPQNGTAAVTPPPSTPESPLAIALPIGAVALFGGAGIVLFRKRRSASSAA